MGGFLGVLRATALIAVAAGALGSLGFMLRAGRRTPRFLLGLFVIWVLSPFAGLLWASMVSKRWSVLAQTAVYCVTLVVALGSLAIYGNLVVVAPAGSANAFVFVAVPPASWLVIAIAVAVAWISERRSRRDHGV